MKAVVADDLPAVRSHRSRADVGILSMGVALLLCAGAQLLLDGPVRGVAAGLSLVAALLLGAAAAVLGGRVAVTATADRTSAALVAALGGALVVLVALAVHADDPLPWSRGVDVALASAGAALAIVHGRRRMSAPQLRRRRRP